MEGRGRRRFLSEEEIELWARVTRHDEPLARARDLQPHAQPETALAVTAPPRAAPGAIRPSPAKPASPARSEARVRPPAPFDPRISKRIARGRREIDARLDLHGLRQQDAYLVLRRFLARCQADGLRHVLIITGKGGNPDKGEAKDFWRSEERGILRRLVPHWLSEPSFRLHVVSFTESALKHGGSGALYVTIRKSPRHPRHGM
jgi:DNA-nicking Smr family endonuclease